MQIFSVSASYVACISGVSRCDGSDIAWLLNCILVLVLFLVGGICRALAREDVAGEARTGVG